MIIRHIPMRSAKKSSFSSLVKYIINSQNKQERVGKVTISNCYSMDPIWAIHEVSAVQAQNQRAKGDKTYHLLISFAPGENPSYEQLKAIENKIVASIGLQEHQRISVLHHDTDNLHIHVAINKINPKTFNMIEPYRTYRIFSEVASKIEIEYVLKITNHQKRKSRSENFADDMEQHSGIESLMNWMKRNCKEKINSAKSWNEVHKILQDYGLKIRIRTNGFVFCNEKNLMVKASSVSRGFSKKNLEAKLGEFIPSPFISKKYGKKGYRYEPLNKKVVSSEIYTRYYYEKEECKIIYSKKLERLREAKSILIEKAKKRGQMKRNALKLMRISQSQKKYLNQHISNTLLKDIQKIREKYVIQQKILKELYTIKTWGDWLKQKAEVGDKEALTALRYRNQKVQINYALSGELSQDSRTNADLIDSITKEGTEIYKMGKTVIRCNGKEIIISKGVSIAALKKAIEMAKQRYDNCIQVKGSPIFKNIILQITIKNKIPIIFSDPEMETLRQKLLLKQGECYARSRSQFNNGRRARESFKIDGTAIGKRRINPSARSNPISIRQEPPTENQNCLRDLSQLDVVQLTHRGKVLLPNHAYDQLERERIKPDNNVRRKFFCNLN